MKQLSLLHKGLTWLSVPMILASLYLIFIWSPVEEKMGIVQKIFYVHVGSAWNAFLAFFVVFVCSIAYLRTRKRTYDIVGSISAEIGLVFTAIVLITGPIWAKSAWNTWWSWEPRLTTTLILFFIYLAYKMIRKLDGSWVKKARLCAVFGIVGFIDVPIVFMAIRWWRTKLHPIVFGQGVNQTGGGVEPEMLITLLFCTATLTVVSVILLRKGVSIEQKRVEVNQWREQVRSDLA